MKLVTISSLRKSKRLRKELFRKWYKAGQAYWDNAFPIFRDNTQLEKHILLGAFSKLSYLYDFNAEEIQKLYGDRGYFFIGDKPRGIVAYMSRKKLFYKIPITVGVYHALHRGFKHESEIEVHYDKWRIILNPCRGFMWPIHFDTQMEAIKEMGRIGIPGHTGIAKPIVGNSNISKRKSDLTIF